MKSKDIQTSDPNNLQPAIPSIGGIVIPGQPFTRDINTDNKTYSATYIRIGYGAPNTDGTLVIEDQDGIPIVFEGVVSGEILPVGKARRVLSGPIVTSKGSFTTDCDKMQWLGGSY